MSKSFPRSYRVRRRNNRLKLTAVILAFAIIGLGVAAYAARNQHAISMRATP